MPTTACFSPGVMFMARADEALYDRMQEELFALNISASELARKIGCSIPTASDWMAGNNLPGTAYLSPLHDIGVDIMYILTGKRIWDAVNYWMDTALADIPTICATCAYDHDCELDACDLNCSACEKAGVCRECKHGSNWLWRGFAPGGVDVRPESD